MPDPTANSRGRASAETITAAAAVIAALVALAVGVWDNIQTRQHNRLSVMPRLVFTVEVDRTDAVVTEGEDTIPGWDTVRVALRNEGVGPAIVDSLLVRVAGPVGDTSVYRSLQTAQPELERLHEGVRGLGTTHVSPGVVLAADREIPIMSFRTPAEGGDASGTFREFLDRFRVLVHYRSIYGDPRSDTLDTFRPEEGVPVPSGAAPSP